MPEYRLLIAEDNPADLLLIRQALAMHQVSCEIDVVESGDAFLNYARESCSVDGPAAKPDLILLDWSVPKSSGAQMVKAIRETERCADAVILVLTSSISPHDRLAAMEAGADDFISKPADLEAFYAIGARVAHELQKIRPALSAGS